MAKSRRHFLTTTSLGLLGAAALPAAAQTPQNPPPAGMPPAFGTGPLVGPEVFARHFRRGREAGAD